MSRRRKVYVKDYDRSFDRKPIVSSLRVLTTRRAGAKEGAFQTTVCVPIKGQSSLKRGMAGKGGRCGHGYAAAPRRALAAALKDLAGAIVKRSSAFRGIRRSSRR